jgi:endonuclease YncB( thermonuclease family)
MVRVESIIRLGIVTLVVALTGATVAWAGQIDPTDIRVIDGDTIRVFQKQSNVRLVGFNAPETRRARCDAERELGDKATRRVRDLVKAGNLDFEFVACSCPPGTEETPACNYGRRCGTLKVDAK